MSDFQSADINELLNQKPEHKENDVNDMFSEYDRKLMKFKPMPRRPHWPQPIRKRICTK